MPFHICLTSRLRTKFEHGLKVHIQWAPKVYPASKVYPPSEFFNFLSTSKKNCNFFHNKIKIGIVFDNEQKFHSSSMIFWTFKNPLDKKFFFSR